MFAMVYDSEFMSMKPSFMNASISTAVVLVTGLVCHGGRSGKIAMGELDKALSDVPDLVLAESVKVRPEHSVLSDCGPSMLAGLGLHTCTSVLVISVPYNRLQ